MAEGKGSGQPWRSGWGVMAGAEGDPGDLRGEPPIHALGNRYTNLDSERTLQEPTNHFPFSPTDQEQNLSIQKTKDDSLMCPKGSPADLSHSWRP